MGRFKTQDPTDVLDWTNDWTDFLADGDSISTRLWTINPDTSPSLLSSETTAAVLVSNLTAGIVYVLAEAVVTANGITGERSIVIRCEEL